MIDIRIRCGWMVVFLTLVSCRSPQAPAATTPAALPPSPSTTTSPRPSQTPESTATLEPSRTPRPSPTPKPSPTLPGGEIFACLPADGARIGAIVAGVIDGDTITVQAGIQSFTVRYIGIDTPETNVVPAERMGLEAKTRNRELVSGQRVILVSDPAVGNTDRYDRLLRHVIVGNIFVNVQLVREGLARYYAGENSCGEVIFAAEFEARADGVGLWNPNPEATP
jgi:micrococcal nuclease